MPDHPRVALGHQAGQPLLEEGTRARWPTAAQHAALGQLLPALLLGRPGRVRAGGAGRGRVHPDRAAPQLAPVIGAQLLLDDQHVPAGQVLDPVVETAGPSAARVPGSGSGAGRRPPRPCGRHTAPTTLIPTGVPRQPGWLRPISSATMSSSVSYTTPAHSGGPSRISTNGIPRWYCRPPQTSRAVTVPGTSLRLTYRGTVLSSYSFSALGSAGGAELLGGTERIRRDLVLIRVQPPGSFPQDKTCDLGERCTAGDRWRPLGTARLRWHVDQTWTRPARSGGSGAPRRGPWLARRPPPTAPDKRAPPGNRLVRGSPGGVWARDIPQYRRAVPGHRMVVPQHAACSNHADDGGCLDDMEPRGRSVVVSRSWCAAVGEMGFEPAVDLLRRPRSAPPGSVDLEVQPTRCDRSCPSRTRGSRRHADPARTSRLFGPVRSRTPPALRSSATRGRSAGRARQGRYKPWP